MIATTDGKDGSGSAALTTVVAVRNRIADGILLVCGIIVIPAVAASLFRVPDVGFRPVMLFHLLLLGGFGFVWVRRHHLALGVKARGIVLVLFLDGVFGLSTWGILAGSTVVLVSAPIVATVLINTRWGVWLGAASAAAVGSAGFAVVAGWITFQFDHAAYAVAPSSWLNLTVAFGVAVGIGVAATGRLTESLLAAIADQQIQVAELDRANRSLQAANAAALAAARAKSAFIAHMSHEFRTPMNAVLGYAQLLGQDPGLSKAQREAVSGIGGSGEHLLAMLNRLLAISSDEGASTQLEELLAGQPSANDPGHGPDTGLAGAGTPSSTGAGDLSRVPRALLDDLRAAVLTADADRIAVLVDRLEQHDPRVAVHISQLTASFAYEELAGLLGQSARPTAGERGKQ